MSAQNKGFTLIELLVVISIIAVLSVVGLVAFQNIRGRALESQRKADINAISKAYEANYDPTANGGQGGYKQLLPSNFANSKIPSPDGTPQTSYILPAPTTNPDGTVPGFAACANVNDGSACFAQSSACFCKTSNQGSSVTLLQNNASSCDPSGNLLNGLVGYWKMDEASWTGAAGEIKDSSPKANHGQAFNGATTVQSFLPNFGRAAQFDGVNNQVQIPISNTLGIASSVTVSLWLKADSDGPVCGDPNPDNNRCGEVPVFAPNWLPDQPLLPAIVKLSKPATIPGNRIVFIYALGTTIELNIDLDKAQHLVYTYDRSLPSPQFKVYISGVEKASYQGTVQFTEPSLIHFGFAGNTAFKGITDDLRIYNRALSEQEISNLYNNGNGCVP